MLGVEGVRGDADILGCIRRWNVGNQVRKPVVIIDGAVDRGSVAVVISAVDAERLSA